MWQNLYLVNLKVLTKVFSLQSFPLPLLGIHQGIFGNHLNKQLLEDGNKTYIISSSSKTKTN